MAYYNDVTRNGDLLKRFFEAGSRFLHAASQRRAARRLYESTLTELTALTDRDLADLGLHRSELKRVAWSAAHTDIAR